MRKDKKKAIYLVLACVNWEGSEVIKAYTDKNMAGAFAEICTEYPKLSPCPDVNVQDDIWDEWDKERVRWENNHPGGDKAIFADLFAVNEVILEG
jgi:hypothetical protein